MLSFAETSLRRRHRDRVVRRGIGMVSNIQTTRTYMMDLTPQSCC